MKLYWFAGVGELGCCLCITGEGDTQSFQRQRRSYRGTAYSWSLQNNILKLNSQVLLERIMTFERTVCHYFFFFLQRSSLWPPINMVGAVCKENPYYRRKDHTFKLTWALNITERESMLKVENQAISKYCIKHAMLEVWGFVDKVYKDCLLWQNVIACDRLFCCLCMSVSLDDGSQYLFAAFSREQQLKWVEELQNCTKSGSSSDSEDSE